MNYSESQVQPTNNLRLKQLQIFVAVAETLSFSRAASMLFVSQSLVSQQISDLEHQTGVPLFVRNQRSVQITPAGEVMLAEANKILQSASDAVKRVRLTESLDYADGNIFVSLEPMYHRETITRAAVHFKMEHPNISLSLSQISYNQIVSGLNEGDVSVGFVLLSKEPLPSSLIAEPLERDCLHIVAAKTLVAQDTLEYYMGLAECLPILLLDKDSRGLNTTMQACHALGITPNFQFYDSASEILLQVESGTGISFLPGNVVRSYKSDDLSDFSLEKFKDAWITLAACWHKNRSSPNITLFLEQCRLNLQKDSAIAPN